MDKEKFNQIVEAAKMYYILDYNQSEIAKKLGISRPTVSRLLQRAKEEGIVQINIVDSSINREELSHELEQKFNLKKAIVASVPQYESHIIKSHLGVAAAEYLHEIVKDGDIIGVTWGTTLYQVAIDLKQKYVNDVQVVQLKGGVSHSEKSTYASEIMYLFGKAYNTPPMHLPLPVIVDHIVVKKAMETDRHIKHILDLGKKANIAVFTTGPIKQDSLLFQLGYFSDEDMNMISANAVGDICSRFFDKDGQICNESLDDRTLGLDLAELKKKEYSVLVAGGNQKIDSIYGALKGKIANVLVTDQYTARFLLDKQE
ncbi:sugar-binding transcriptional regulator [Niallia nealsonii]|nr:sugar-binding transcriptional regulator [Niallia nealsonii]